jgi:hypothetical protein
VQSYGADSVKKANELRSDCGGNEENSLCGKITLHVKEGLDFSWLCQAVNDTNFLKLKCPPGKILPKHSM